MADVLIFEFSAPNAHDLYRETNKALGIDPDSGHGNWPAGMLQHTAGVDGDKLVVVEVWNSRAEQEKFMNERLGAALGQTGVPEPARVQWFEAVGAYHTH